MEATATSGCHCATPTRVGRFQLCRQDTKSEQQQVLDNIMKNAQEEKDLGAMRAGYALPKVANLGAPVDFERKPRFLVAHKAARRRQGEHQAQYVRVWIAS